MVPLDFPPCAPPTDISLLGQTPVDKAYYKPGGSLFCNRRVVLHTFSVFHSREGILIADA